MNVSLGFWNLMLYFRCVMSARTSALWLTLNGFFKSFRILPLKSRVKHTPEYIMVRSKCSYRIKTCSNGAFIFLRNHWNLSHSRETSTVPSRNFLFSFILKFFILNRIINHSLNFEKLVEIARKRFAQFFVQPAANGLNKFYWIGTTGFSKNIQFYHLDRGKCTKFYNNKQIIIYIYLNNIYLYFQA